MKKPFDQQEEIAEYDEELDATEQPEEDAEDIDAEEDVGDEADDEEYEPQVRKSAAGYGERMEMLIQAALADGEVTDKERQILLRRAKAEGIDADELEMVLDARVLKMQQKEQAKQQKKNKQQPQPKQPEKKSNKLGEVRKCPNCGATIGSFQMTCPECGYEFSQVGVNQYVAQFAKGLEELAKTTTAGPMSIFFSLFDNGQYADQRKEENLILAEARFVRNYPLPMTKEDCVEALNFILPKISLMGSNGATLAWRNKYMAIIQKMELEAIGNPKLQQTVQAYKQKGRVGGLSLFFMWYKSLSKAVRVIIWLIIFYAVFFSILIPLVVNYAF